MRAVLIKDEKGPIESLYLGEAAKPTPGPEEVLVKVKAFGLNRMDILQREGRYPVPPGTSKILGVEFSGRVAATGESVTACEKGDEVLGLASGGAYAEYITVPQKNIMQKPDHLSWVEAASIPENFLTAFQALVVIAEVKRGDNVLIHAGASGVGVAAIQLVRLYGANTVTATASTAEKLSWLLSIPNGATHVVNYTTQNFADEVKKTTNGKGVDVIIDFVGQSHWHKNIDALAVDGRMTMLGLLSGGEVGNFNLGPLLYKRLRIQGSTLRARSAAYQADLIDRFKRDALGKITGSNGDGALRTYIHKVYPWTAIQEAHREMEENKNIGKIVAEVA
ncbi:quinone oxidoreductase [Laetiporus sulphureus 93-53]|uniref:Quinone oxidoreductase n=1 Tax=Laetiporus sulphureus 93-53 TaxID=1314785 RepID=A0A165HJ72_9APHY|nr:quinone oxidoreductase [Laetiporus sulphureus 93-53]KZT11797.1 quinone oxidoreductase [Laetiporus sulphureus 93-53]